MSQDLIGKPPVAPLDTTGAVSMEPLISARTSLSLLRGAGSNATSGAPVLSTPGVTGAAASRAPARSMSPNGRARGEHCCLYESVWRAQGCMYFPPVLLGP
jgi:hypothetical protein